MSSVVISGDVSGSVTLQAPPASGSTVLTLPATSGTLVTTASTTGISGSAISSGTVAEAYGGTGTTTGYYGFKNRIINGGMVIDQRNVGAEVSPAPSGYGIDRWATYKSGSGTWKIDQSTDAPAGFTNSALLTVTATSTPSGNDYYIFMQPIEGFNTADLAWGTASAQAVSLSFWVKSSVTGTFGGALRNSAENRTYPFTFSISSANTWEQKAVTISGDTSGTWLTTNGRGITLDFSLGGAGTSLATANAWSASGAIGATGQTNWISNSGATFYITGVQLEKGSTATSFDYRPYGTELVLCQRYCFAIRGSQGPTNYNNGLGVGTWNGSDGGNVAVNFPVSMRVYPSSITVSSASHFQFVREALAWETATTVALATDATGPNIASVAFATATRDTRGYATRGRTNSADAVLAFNAEL